jgi:hypothetical protein
MDHRTFVLATVALLAGVAQVSAHEPAPKVPTALVEDVRSASAGVEFMDYVGSGQVIKLGPHDTLVLSYLQSCEQETITGGTVVVGTQQSNVQGGQIARAKSPCDGGNVRLSEAEASKSAASAFRVQSAGMEVTLYAQAPAVAFPKMLPGKSRTLVISRVGHAGERYSVKISDAAAAAGFYDLAKMNLSLARGGIYMASLGGQNVPFRIDANAQSGPAPIASRLLRFE